MYGLSRCTPTHHSTGRCAIKPRSAGTVSYTHLDVYTRQAQRIVPPSERRVAHPEGERDPKLDLRCYAYAGKVQLTAARLYQGQTTNFRTPGGGFAAVLVLDSEEQ